MKDSSLTGKDLKNESVTGADVRGLTGRDFTGGLPIGPQGAQGSQGPKGDKGNNGSDATFNGVAAGGDLDGTYPNPTLRLGAVTPDHFSNSAFPTAVTTVRQLTTGQSVSLSAYQDSGAGLAVFGDRRKLARHAQRDRARPRCLATLRRSVDHEHEVLRGGSG